MLSLLVNTLVFLVVAWWGLMALASLVRWLGRDDRSWRAFVVTDDRDDTTRSYWVGVTLIVFTLLTVAVMWATFRRGSPTGAGLETIPAFLIWPALIGWHVVWTKYHRI